MPGIARRARVRRSCNVSTHCTELVLLLSYVMLPSDLSASIGKHEALPTFSISDQSVSSNKHEAIWMYSSAITCILRSALTVSAQRSAVMGLASRDRGVSLPPDSSEFDLTAARLDTTSPRPRLHA
jgi:hypothetical protein